MTSSQQRLEPGTLWNRVLEQTAHAIRQGALVSIATEGTRVADRGVDFHVRIVANLARKDKERRKALGLSARTSSANPFLPYEEDLFVSDLTPTHICLLNKFNVVDYHVLMVTRAFEDQRLALTREDFEAMWLCLAEYPGLAFYNAGTEAGASQAHKHLQMIPSSAVTGGGPLPIEAVFPNLEDAAMMTQVPALPFLNRFVRLPATSGQALSDLVSRSFELYGTMLRELKLVQGVGGVTLPYNLLVTREWMLMAPRSKEFFESISINAIGFCGAFLVRSQAELEILTEKGPMAALASVGKGLRISCA